MGFHLVGRVFAIPPGYLTTDERLVLAAYAYKADDDFTARPTAWPSQKTVAKMCGWSDRRRVVSRVAALKSAGWMYQGTDRKAEQRTERGRFRTPVWVLNLPEPEWWKGDDPTETFRRHGVRPTDKATAMTDRARRTTPRAHPEPTDVGSSRAYGPWAHPEPTPVGSPRAHNQKGESEVEISEADISHLAADETAASEEGTDRLAAGVRELGGLTPDLIAELADDEPLGPCRRCGTTEAKGYSSQGVALCLDCCDECRKDVA